MSFSVLRNIKTIVFAILVLPVGTAWARGIIDFFAEAPVEVLPLLDRITRLDMLDYFTHGFETSSHNALEGNSRITEMSENKIIASLSRDADFELAMFTMKEDTLLVTIETVLTPIPDSYVRIFHSDWTPLAPQPQLPTAFDFIPADLRSHAKKCEMPNMVFMKADFNPETGMFLFRNTTTSYYTISDRPEGLTLMCDSLLMTFDGRRFVESKAKKK